MFYYYKGKEENFEVAPRTGILFKGQLISKELFGVIVWTKDNNKIYLRISALAQSTLKTDYLLLNHGLKHGLLFSLFKFLGEKTF